MYVTFSARLQSGANLIGPHSAPLLVACKFGGRYLGKILTSQTIRPQYSYIPLFFKLSSIDVLGRKCFLGFLSAKYKTVAFSKSIDPDETADL